MAAAAAAVLPAQDPELARVFRGHRDAVTSVAFCGPAMKQAVSGSLDGFVMVWNFAPKMRAFRYIGHTAAVTSVAYDSTHNLIASTSKDKTVRLWTPSAAGRSTVLKAHTAGVRSCAFSQNGRMLATCSDDKTVKVWSVPQQSFLCSLTGHTNWVRTCQLSPDARLAVSGGDDHSVRVWDVETRTAVSVFEELDGGTANVARFHPDGNCVATGGTDGCIKLWDLRSARIIQYYEAHEGAVTDVSFHPSGNFLLSSAMDSTLKVWDLQEGLLFYTLHGHEGPTLGVSFSPGGDQFASAGADGTVMTWRTNFDACLSTAVAAVAVRGGVCDGGGSKRQQQQQGTVAAWRPGGVGSKACPSLAAVGRPKTAPRPQQQQQRGAINSIGGMHTAQQLEQSEAGTLAAVASQGALDAGLAGVLQHMVQQLDVLTQTVAAIEERVTISEDRGRRMEAALAQITAQQHARQQAQQPAQQQEQATQQRLSSVLGVKAAVGLVGQQLASEGSVGEDAVPALQQGQGQGQAHELAAAATDA